MKIKTFEPEKQPRVLRPLKQPLTCRPATDIKGVSCPPRTTTAPNRKGFREVMRSVKSKEREELSISEQNGSHKSKFSKRPLRLRRKQRRAQNKAAKTARLRGR